MQMIISIILIISMIIVVSVMGGFYFIYGNRALTEGAPAWILAILGAPTTFLYWVIHAFRLDPSLFLQYFWIILLFLLQYQLVGIFYLSLTRRSIRLLSIKGVLATFALWLVVVLSAILMYKIILPKP